MAKSFEELQRIAEGCGGTLEHAEMAGYVLKMSNGGFEWSKSLTPIRVILAGELEKRADEFHKHYEATFGLTAEIFWSIAPLPTTVACRALAAELLADNEAEKPKEKPVFDAKVMEKALLHEDTILVWRNKGKDKMYRVARAHDGNPCFREVVVHDGPKEPTTLEKLKAEWNSLNDEGEGNIHLDALIEAFERIAALEGK